MRSRPTFYVPRDDQWSRNVNPDHWSEAAYLVNLIHWRWMCWRADDDGFVRLKVAYLRRVIDRCVLKELRPALVDAGVLDWDHSYVEGQRSMRYRIRESFWQTRRVECTDVKLSRRIWRIQDESERKLLPVHKWLRDRLSMLKFDLPMAESIIAAMVPDSGTPLTGDEYRTLLTEQVRRLNQQMIDRTPELSVCRFGRVHTAITRLPAMLRRCLTFDGQPLIGIDLRNSQPLFCGLIAHEFKRSRQYRNCLLKFEPPMSIGYGRHKTGRQQPPHRPCITMEKVTEVVENKHGYGSCLADKPDLKMYLEQCEQGEFYDALMSPGEDRGRFKQRFFTDVLFGRDSYPSELRDRCSKQYPTVAAMLADLKQKDYRRPSWLMQTRESTLFIGRVCRRIMADRPDIPLATIHDSFLTTAEHAEYVEGIALDEFARLGVKPTFKHETYC